MQLRCFLIATFYFLLFGCAGSSHPGAIIPSEGMTMPRYLELDSDTQIATLHFPRGAYELNAEDRIGYYYRASREITEHIGGAGAPREGGIFVSKRNSKKLRGYVYRSGTITLVGNLSHRRHSFRD